MRPPFKTTKMLIRPLFALALVPALAMGQSHPGGKGAPTGVSNIRSAPIAPNVREQTADQQVMQVLNRLAFGPRPGEAADVRRIGVDAWIEQQLHPERINDSAIDQLVARYPLLNQPADGLIAQYTQAQRERRQIKKDASDTTQAAAANVDVDALKQIQKQRAQLAGELMSARVARAVTSDRQLLEVTTDFWENHFNVYVRKNAVEAYYLPEFDRTIRDHALGKFRDLLGAVAHTPAMLVYLDNAQSRANPGQPTLPAQGAQGAQGAQQRGRRAFALGGNAPNAMTPNIEDIIRRRNLNAQQAQRLRQFAAKAKTAGLNENYGRELLELHTLGVDGGYSQQDVIEAARALTGWTIRPPAQGGGYVFRPEWHDAGAKVFLGHKLAAGRGEQDGEDVLDIVARSPATAHFIARGLAERFVSDSPSTALVDRAAATFTRTDGDIREVVRTIVTSPEFFSARAYHSKVKSPFEVVVSAARALGAQADTTPRTALAVAYLGEPLFGHQAPNGWPEIGESWMNTGAILNRINFGMAVAANRLPGMSISGVSGSDTLERAARDVQVDAVVASVLGGAVSPDMRKILMSGEHPLAASAAEHAATSQTAMRAAVDATVNAEPDAAAGNMTAATSMIDNNARPVRAKGAAKQNGILGGGGRNALGGPAPQLTGFAQVVGLAIGSPEFQRR